VIVAFRVLTPGGRLGISDVAAEDTLTIEQRSERATYVGCIVGARQSANITTAWPPPDSPTSPSPPPTT
jgi:hypothetical protein